MVKLRERSEFMKLAIKKFSKGPVENYYEEMMKLMIIEDEEDG